MEQFFLKNIELVHFRKFEEAIFDLNPRMYVFRGISKGVALRNLLSGKKNISASMK